MSFVFFGGGGRGRNTHWGEACGQGHS
jgi:hypothetical protein